MNKAISERFRFRFLVDELRLELSELAQASIEQTGISFSASFDKLDKCKRHRGVVPSGSMFQMQSFVLKHLLCFEADLLGFCS